MYNVIARNVNDALAGAVDLMNHQGVAAETRNGPVRYLAAPICIMYACPTERVLFNETRDANPFFHFFESLWMLSGRNDVGYVAKFAKSIANYSDNGKTFWGAYGYRWRNHFNAVDQIEEIVAALKADKSSRRCVLQMWDGSQDLVVARQGGKDVPCNTSAMFLISPEGRLNMTVTNRSNDLVWGCFGANMVHFSYLLEYMAGRIGVEVGYYWHFSNNLHMYDKTAPQVRDVIFEHEQDHSHEPYVSELVDSYPMFSSGQKDGTWDEDLAMFMENPSCFGYRHTFFKRVAKPMWFAFQAYQQIENPERFSQALEIVGQCVASDWRVACEDWIQRREAAHIRKMEKKNAA